MKNITLSIFLFVSILLSFKKAESQVSISGTTCVVAGGSSGYQYTISGSWGVTDNVTWTITGGVIAGTSNTSISGTISSLGPNIRIVWNQNAGSSARINLTESRLGSTQLNVTVITATNTLTPSNQSVNYGTSATISGGGLSTGCSPSYSFWWESSSNSAGPFSTISGQVSQSIAINPFTQKTYYRRAISFNGDVVYTNVALVDIIPLSVGSISASVFTINYNSQPSISQTPAAGGFCSTLNYEWQQSVEGSPWQAIGSGATYPAGAPPLVGSTLIRRKVMCSNQVLFTNILAFTVTYTSANTENLNYIRENSMIMPGVKSWPQADQLLKGQKLQQTTYSDGLGRSIEEVQKQLSPSGKDMVNPIVYDNFDRIVTNYLPYVSSTNDGKYKASPLTEQNSFNSSQFPGEQYYYGQINFEASPLNRAQTTFAPGLNWVGANRGIQEQQLVNTISDSVRQWRISFTSGSLPTSTSAYAAGLLYKVITTDEQSHQTIVYKDKDGKVILKKVQLSPSPGLAHVGWLCTYYVFDDLNNLRFVLQPRAVELINSNWSLTQPIANELCFRYEYDQRNRLVIKKDPGAGEIWLVYDAIDRNVMVQDSVARLNGKWLIMIFDSLDRQIATGFINDTHNRVYHATNAQTSTSYPNLSSYTYGIYEGSFFDDYSWISSYGAPFTPTRNSSYDNKFFTPSNSTFPYPQPFTQAISTRGMVTGIRTQNLSTGSMLYSMLIYDDRSRNIQTQTTNATGGTDITTFQYDYVGRILETYVKIEKQGTNAQTHFILTKNNYDSAGRLVSILKNVDNAPSDQPIETNSYNELGQLQNKQLGTNVESLAYDYNIRGWLKSINKNFLSSGAGSYFGLELGYDKLSSVVSTTTYNASQYNGNITGTLWRSSGDGVARKYDFVYDVANRLLTANFLQNTAGSSWDSNYVCFNVNNLSYDANGNILSMNQKGFKVGGSSLIDQLVYQYKFNNQSNQLLQVNDVSNDAQTKLGDFHFSGTKQITDTDYVYDGNGSLVTDKNKGILNGISYNFLNLPQLVHKSGKGYVQNNYDGMGRKLSSVNLNEASQPVTTILYLGPCVFQNDTLQFITHEEGRTRWAYHKYLNGSSGYGFEYDFFIRDHLGNTRLVLTQQKDTALYLATMEAAFRNTETQLFNNITTTSYKRSLVAGYPNDLTVTNPNDSVSRVNGNSSVGKKTGPSLLLKVMSGDKIDISVQSYYNSGTTSTPNSSITDVLNSLANGVVTMTSGGKGSVTDLNNTGLSPIYSALNSFLTSQDSNTTSRPKAYLNWILLDEQLKYVSNYPQSGAIVVGNAGTLNTLGYTGISISKNGFLYIWVSNETPNWDVYFDNLAVRHYPGPILEETHYYPFGLSMAGICSKALKQKYSENKFKYNGKEFLSNEFTDTTGLDWFDYGARMYDPQIGRWGVIDPLVDKALPFSPYCFTIDNPVNLIDPDGRLTIDPKAKGVQRQALIRIVKEARAHIASLGKNSKELKSLLASSGFKTKEELMNFLKMDNTGPVVKAEQMTYGNQDKGLDDGQGSAAVMGKADNTTIRLDAGLVEAVEHGIISENAKPNDPYGSFNGAPGYNSPDVKETMEATLSFVGRVFEHEVTHSAAFMNLNLEPGHDNVNFAPFGINMSIERGRFFEFMAFGNLGHPFNPDTNPSWAIAREYTITQYNYTHDRKTLSASTKDDHLNSALQQRAELYHLQKSH